MAIYDKLYPLTQVSNDVKQRHIENINSFKWTFVQYKKKDFKILLFVYYNYPA
jgi:hypothetical protein